MDKEAKVIARLREAAFYSERLYNGAPLIITTSGGKDSDVCLELARCAGIRYEVMHNHTTVDAPETVYHVRKTLRLLEEQGIKCTVNMPTYKGAPVTMWRLIPQKLIPATRRVRYCCSILKEHSTAGQMITTGVRWAESARRRRDRAALETQHRQKEKRILLNDNDDRSLFETCQLKGNRICNLIIDWTDSDVWSFIESEKIQTNPLYQCGFSRVGCVGCPLAGRRHMEQEFAYKRAYIHAFERMLEARKTRGLKTDMWRTAEDVYHWWLANGVLTGQMSIEGMETD